MNPPLPRQWIDEQRHQGHELCLILDSLSEMEARQTLLNGRAHDRYAGVYQQTPAAKLANAGPYLIVIDSADTEHVCALLQAPERNWGWLASIAPGELPALLQHWRERCLVGTRPNLAMYRFHDNRVLSRAFEYLSVDALSTYLGPAISVCYWQGEHWAVIANPAPGEYPMPDEPQWLQVPTPQSIRAHLRETNAHRYLLAQHQHAYLQLAAQCQAWEWISEQRQHADAWGWNTPEQLEFLLTHSLQTPGFELPVQWHPRPDETPDAHFERVLHAPKYWAGEGPL